MAQAGTSGPGSSTSLVPVGALGMSGCQAEHCSRKVEGLDLSHPTAVPW